MRGIAAIAFSLVISVSAFAQTMSYYLFDGDSQKMYIVQGGVLQSTVTTFDTGYPPAIRTTIRLLDRHYDSMHEYSLAGAPIGSTSKSA